MARSARTLLFVKTEAMEVAIAILRSLASVIWLSAVAVIVICEAVVVAWPYSKDWLAAEEIVGLSPEGIKNSSKPAKSQKVALVDVPVAVWPPAEIRPKLVEAGRHLNIEIHLGYLH